MKHRHAPSVFVFALLAGVLPGLVLSGVAAPLARADGPASPDARALVARLLATDDADAREALVEQIGALGPDAAEVHAWLAAGVPHAADVPTGWLQRKNLCTDGVERNVLLFVPPDYTPEKAYRLVVDMHGGVGRGQMLSFEDLEQMKFFWGETAAEEGWILAIPTGQRGAEWWTPVGARNVLDVIQEVRRLYHVDENQVFATGFSDGGSGSFYMALTHTTPFAAFVPLNGHLAVAQVGGHQVHLRNLLNKPLYVVNTENDSLYPSASVKPIIEALQAMKPDGLVWRDIPTFTHNPMYLPAERPAILEWMARQTRAPHPRKVHWQGTADAPHRVHWLDGIVVEAGKGDATLGDPNPPLPAGRVRVGITLDQAFEGPGLKIGGISDGSAAAGMGLKVGDVVVGFDATDVEGIDALRRVLGTKSHGDAFTVVVLRGDERLTLTGAFPAAEPKAPFRREQPWGAIEAEVSGNVFDVKTRDVGAFDLYLSGDLVDLTKPIVVKVNGAVVHEGRVENDLAFTLRQAAEDRDRAMVYAARLRIVRP